MSQQKGGPAEPPSPRTRRPKIRLYVDQPLSAGAEIVPSPAQCHYLLTVMRQGAGAPVALFNGRDGEWRARIEPSGHRDALLVATEQLRAQMPEPGPALLFAPIKRPRLEFLVEKATELGALKLEPVLTRRSVVDRVNLGRLTGIAIEAAEQCGRLSVPAIGAPQRLEVRLADQLPERPLYLADETGGGAPLLQALRHGPGDLLIGPEGGFDPDELGRLRRAPAIVAVSLGPRILRAETAALAALACWQAAVGAGSQGAG